MGELIDTTRKARLAARSANIRQADIAQRSNRTYGGNNPYNSPARDNYQTYPYDYFCGADAKIFFGDVWVDDIATIQYNINQSKTPIWGYASQYYDAIAKGQVIVQGNLSIQFKEVGYLNVIQRLLEQQRSQSTERIKKSLQKYQLRAEYGAAKYIPGLNTREGENGVVHSANGTPQFIRQGQTIEEILEDKIIGTSLGTSFFEKGKSSQEKHRDFEDFAELLEDTIWGDSNNKPYEAKLNKGLRRPDEFDYNNNGGIIVGRPPYDDVLNILLTFGDINDFRSEHTIISINDVHFQSQGFIVAIDGSPIAEQYSFFARNINDSIGHSKVYRINPIKLDVGIDDLEISKLENIDAIQDQLIKERIPQFIKIVAKAALPRGGLWKNISNSPEGFTLTMDHFDVQSQLNEQFDDSFAEVEKYASRDSRYAERKTQEALDRTEAIKNRYQANEQFSFNSHEPLVDQIIKYVEREFNEFKRTEIDLNNSQYIVDVEFRSSPNGSVDNTITMVLEQSVPNSRTYKVIAPTRQNYGATNIITRTDLFRDIAPIDEFNEELEAMEKDLQDKQRRALDKQGEYEDELKRLTEEKADKLTKDLVNINKDIERLRAKDDLNVFQQNKLERLERDQIEIAYQIETLTDDQYNEDDRSLLRRSNRDDFDANRYSYDQYGNIAEHYGDEANRVTETQNEFEDEYVNNGVGGVQYDLSMSPSAQQLQNDANLLTRPEFNPQLQQPGTDLAALEEQRSDQLQDANAQRLQEIGDRLAEFDPNEIGTDPSQHNSDDIRALLEDNGILTKDPQTPFQEPVDYSTFSQESIAGLLTTEGVISDVVGQGRTLVTSAWDSFDLHQDNSRHLTGDAFDIRSQDFTDPEKDDIHQELINQLGPDYTVLLEDRGTDNEHFHIQYNRPEGQQPVSNPSNLDLYRSNQPIDDPVSDMTPLLDPYTDYIPESDDITMTPITDIQDPQTPLFITQEPVSQGYSYEPPTQDQLIADSPYGPFVSQEEQPQTPSSDGSANPSDPWAPGTPLYEWNRLIAGYGGEDEYNRNLITSGPDGSFEMTPGMEEDLQLAREWAAEPQPFYLEEDDNGNFVITSSFSHRGVTVPPEQNPYDVLSLTNDQWESATYEDRVKLVVLWSSSAWEEDL